MKRYKSKFNEGIIGKDVNIYHAHEIKHLKHGDKVFSNYTGCYYIVTELHGQNILLYQGVVIPRGWDDAEVQILK